MVSPIKWKYGRFNAVQKPKFSRRIEKNSNNAILNSRESMREVLYNQKLDLQGEFIGIILKKLPNPKHIDTESTLTRIWRSFGLEDDTPPLTLYKVRVPEVHAMIPEPTDSEDDRAIGLHDTFTYVPTDGKVGEFAWEQTVVVSFYDSGGVFAPKIIKMFPEGANRSSTGESDPDAKVENDCDLPTAPATGDTIGSGVKENNQVASTIETPPCNSGLIIAANHVGKTRVEILPSEIYTENRVRVHEGIATLPKDSSLLTSVPVRPGYSRSKGKVHKLVAERFMTMREAALSEGIEIYCQSGWRARQWQNVEDYEKDMIKEYGSVEKGRQKRAFISAHETGLAVDFFIPGNDDDVDIAPSQPGWPKYGKDMTAKQHQTKAFKWLKNNAHLFGFTPYKEEPWHWEVLLPIDAWKTGREITEEYDISNYSIRVRETSIANGTKTTDKDFSFE